MRVAGEPSAGWRRHAWRRAVACSLLALLVAAGNEGAAPASPQASPEARSERLFSLRRSTNANVVAYDAVLRGDRFDPEKPIRVYWILEERGGSTEELTRLERRRAYGIEVVEASPRRVVFSLVALPSRPITALVEEHGPAAYIDLRGKRVRLESVYVSVKDGSLIPSVRYVEVQGRDPDTGARVIERFEA